MINVVQFNTFEELETFLRKWVNWHGDPAPYDPVGAVSLMAALLDGMNDKFQGCDLEDIKGCLNESQVAMLRKILSANND